MLTIKSIIVGAPADLREQLERVRGRVTLVRRLAALCVGHHIDYRAGEGGAQGDRATLARPAQEIGGHDRELDTLVSAAAPQLTAAPGFSNATGAELLLLARDNPERIHGEGAFAKLCGRQSSPCVKRANQSS